MIEFLAINSDNADKIDTTPIKYHSVLRKEHRPLALLRLQQRLNALYVNHFLRPQFDSLGCTPFFIQPRAIKLAGYNIHAGNHLHIIADRNKPVSLSCWSSKQDQGNIHIGDHCLISPGVQIASAKCIRIDDNCMIAAEVNISDCDWHGVYNRTRPFRCSEEVHIKHNAWIGLRAIIGKGVTIGENSIVGAGAVVTSDVPDNTIVGGNPAVMIKRLNPNKRKLTREFLFKHDQGDANRYLNAQRQLDEYLFSDNTAQGWLKSRLFPNTRD